MHIISLLGQFQSTTYTLSVLFGLIQGQKIEIRALRVINMLEVLKIHAVPFL